MRALTLITFLAILPAVGCTATSGLDFEPAVSQAEQIEVQFAELQKTPGYTEAKPIIDYVTVWNCDTPIGRRDTLSETRTVERTIDWWIELEGGVEAEAGVVLADAAVRGAITTGYQLEVTDAIGRESTLDLPVDPYSSYEYQIVWTPIVWSGYLPFTHQSGEGRIVYLYQEVGFGKVRGFANRTEIDCGHVVRPEEFEQQASVPQLTFEPTTGSAPAISNAEAPSPAPPPTREPLWLENQGNLPPAGATTITRELTTSEKLYVTGGSFQVGDVFCGEDAAQICILVYEATYPQAVTLNYVIPENNFVARTRALSYDDLIRIHTDYYWQAPNCGSGCAKATIIHMQDGRLVTGPVTMLRP